MRNEDGGWGQSSESRMLEIEISEVSHWSIGMVLEMNDWNGVDENFFGPEQLKELRVQTFLCKLCSSQQLCKELLWFINKQHSKIRENLPESWYLTVVKSNKMI